MDFLQLIMQQMGSNFNHQINFDDVIQKYTNRKFLVESHEASLGTSLRAHERLQSGDELRFQNTSTTVLKSLPTVSINNENRIALSQLIKSIDEPVAGKYLLCRSLCPPVKLTSLFTVVDDPDGKLSARIALYNFVRNASRSQPKDVYQYLPVGTMLAIMNPWFKKTADGGLTIRCDNPAEVVILDQSTVTEIFGGVTWKGEIPVKYRVKALLSDSIADWKVTGNQLFAQKRFSAAIKAYSSGIDDGNISGKNRLDLLANRSAAFLAVHNYNLGLADAESVLAVDSTHIKCIFRKAKALYGLARYRDALAFLSDVSLGCALPNGHRKIVADLTSKAKSWIEQSEKGDYPWMAIYENKFEELAEFVGPVIVKNTLEKGRGLFATATIKAGQLILVSKAFARVVSDGSNEFLMNLHFDQNTDQKYASDREQTLLVTEIAHILKENPEKFRELYNLYAGPEFENRDGPIGSAVDLKRIEAICIYNQFGHDGPYLSGKQRHCGVWLSASYINHSCLDANSNWYPKGDFIFVFAFRDIAANEEIQISYVAPSKDLQKLQRTHKFICDCRLCIRNMQDDSSVRTERSNLISRMDEILKKYGGLDTGGLDPFHIERDDNELTKILAALHDLRKDAPELDFGYVNQMLMLSAVYFRNRQFVKSVTILEKAYSLVANIAAFSASTPSISSNIVGAYMALGQMDKIEEWTRVLQRNSNLAFGTWKVIEMAFPSTYKSIKRLGISLTDM